MNTTNSKMKALIYNGIRDVELKDKEIPACGPEDVELSIIVQSKHARNFPSPYRIASPHRR